MQFSACQFNYSAKFAYFALKFRKKHSFYIFTNNPRIYDTFRLLIFKTNKTLRS